MIRLFLFTSSTIDVPYKTVEANKCVYLLPRISKSFDRPVFCVTIRPHLYIDNLDTIVLLLVLFFIK